jgi:lipoprotein-anchoring transpeptidase ErfK/SrfK
MSANHRMGLFCAFAFASVFALPVAPAAAQTLASLPQYTAPADQPSEATADDTLAALLRRQVVSYPTAEPPGTIVIDTAHTFLYLTLGGGKALRYGIGVGRAGFTWSGVEKITRKAEWPDWIPPVEMVDRQPYLPRWVGGGPGNPLGARALYLGNTDYRIHGTNDPSSIGKYMSSGCIRLLNADVMDLYNRVGLGTKVVVLPNHNARASAHADGRVDIGDGRMTARIVVDSAGDRDDNAGQAGVY